MDGNVYKYIICKDVFNGYNDGVIENKIDVN